MGEDNMSKKGMLADVLTYVLEMTRSQVELRLKDPDNSEIASIFDSSNHQTLFSKLESRNLNQHDYNVFMEFYFSGETGISPPGVPHESLPNRQNGWDSSGLRAFFGIDTEKNPILMDDANPEKLNQAWIELYSNPENTELSEIAEIKASLERYLRANPKKGGEETWLSNVCFLLRKSSRLYYKQGNQQKRFRRKRNDEHSESEKRLGLSWLLEMFRKAQLIGESFDSILAQQASFLFCYEQAVVFNYLGAHDRALDKIEEAAVKSKHQLKWPPSDVIHPVLKDPKQFCAMFLNLTRSWCGKAIDVKSVIKTIHEAIAMCEPSKGDGPFAKNAAAVLHYYSLLSLFNDGSLSTVTDVERPWEQFREMHPTFYPTRTTAYIELSRSPSHPWSQELCDGYEELISESEHQEQRQPTLEALVKSSKQVWGKNLDLSINNPLSKYTANRSSFAEQINDWSAYIDMIHINQLRTTQGGSHHFDHFGPLKDESGTWFWIQGVSPDKKELQQRRNPYFVDQYLSQSFRLSSKPKSTKMDRINLMATVIKQLAQTLEKYVPKEAKNLVKRDVLNRLQKPILIPEEYIKPIPKSKPKGKGQVDPTRFIPHHRHIGIDRVLSLSDALSSVESMVQLATLQQSYRHGVEQILDNFREQLGLEFAHLILCLKHPVNPLHEYNAVTLVLKLRERISKDTLLFDYERIKSRIEEYELRLESARNKHEEMAESSNNEDLQDEIDWTARELDRRKAELEDIVLEIEKQHKMSRDALKDEKTRRDHKTSIPKHRENQLLKSDYLDFEFKQFESTQGYVDRYVKDKRAQSILATLSSAPWWKYDLATLTEEELAQTMVNWIRHRANEPPIPLIHPRSRGGK